MARPRHWIKLWVAWLTTPAHFELSEGAFGLGPLLLLLATWDGEYNSGGWLLAEDGSPMSERAMARATHRGSIRRLLQQLCELERCGTLKRREDGAYGFPKFGRWQETEAAKRMRTKRERLPNSSANGSGNSSTQTLDEESQVSSKPGRDKPAKQPDPHHQDTDRVLAALHDARCSVKPGLTRLRKRDHIRARLADGATVDQLLAVIAYAADECRRKPESLQWLDAVTPFRPKNWESRLARAEAWQSRAPAGPVLDLTVADLDRRRAEAEAWDAANGRGGTSDAG